MPNVVISKEEFNEILEHVRKEKKSDKIEISHMYIRLHTMPQELGDLWDIPIQVEDEDPN